jgi:hypothetical protein
LSQVGEHLRIERAYGRVPITWKGEE